VLFFEAFTFVLPSHPAKFVQDLLQAGRQCPHPGGHHRVRPGGKPVPGALLAEQPGVPEVPDCAADVSLVQRGGLRRELARVDGRQIASALLVTSLWFSKPDNNH
jgi:hypothetical protein